ncbi:hypothetical protein QBC38DRAFT_29336 [Podospora fimiseda]|uniref:Uncharacterized protein n=1 Tax=Podospora fimiseda TaxID=252190 RepID=A0AAN7H6S5_9PEZI|nr:hypothetical protein QBC38DRAFT_29336 [Podospora fimiseda]
MRKDRNRFYPTIIICHKLKRRGIQLSVLFQSGVRVIGKKNRCSVSTLSISLLLMGLKLSKNWNYRCLVRLGSGLIGKGKKRPSHGASGSKRTGEKKKRKRRSTITHCALEIGRKLPNRPSITGMANTSSPRIGIPSQKSFLIWVSASWCYGHPRLWCAGLLESEEYRAFPKCLLPCLLGGGESSRKAMAHVVHAFSDCHSLKTPPQVPASRQSPSIRPCQNENRRKTGDGCR